MTDSFKLVEFFIKQYLASSAKQMKLVVAQDFSYYINFGEPLSFKEFTDRMWFLQSSSDVVFGELSSEDDIHFYSEFKLTLPAPNDNKQAIGLAQFVVKNKLISKVFVDYREDADKFEEFQNMMKKSPTVLL
ncbi:MAG: hypothetical protein HRU29_12075 [Rhizobiales bacterium]|nr:hypothetical protein [Hyphomicrobiales bacterium]NRB15125.1 hypothetical protein [Hyphomicrobiales bacterium]